MAQMATIQLREICGYRSGDKGNTVNLALLADDAEVYQWIKKVVTVDLVKKHFGRMFKGAIERYEADNVLALNFVCHEALAGGGPSSLRSDNLGKTLAGALLRMTIEVPDTLAQRRRQRPDTSWTDVILQDR